jgi:outer membrane receptor for ferrienterochelin and colicins
MMAALLGVAPGGADDRAPDFGGLSMEQLLDVDLVYAASRHAQTLRDAPSAVTVVSADEIRRQGYRTLGDLLGAMPSFYATNDRNYGYVGVRGFGRPGDYNTRILFLLNGVRLNDNIYGAQNTGTEFPLDIGLIERVEVVRGPAASLYGNNAFFAVVNVVTRRGSDLKGGEVALSAGSFGTYEGRATYGGRLGAKGDFLVSTSMMGSGGQDLFYREFEAESGGWARGVDGDRARRAFASASWGGLSFQTAYSWRRKDVPTASFGTVFGDAWSQTWDESTLAALQYQRTLGKADVFARAHHGRSRYRGHYAYDDHYADFASGDWWTAEAGTTLTAGRHLVSTGVEMQRNSRQQQGAAYLGSPADVDVSHDGTRWGLYIRDEVRLSESWRAHVGLRLDTFDGGDRQSGRSAHTSPRLGLVYTGGPHALKLLFGTAFRAPNEYELHYYPLQGPVLPETLRTLEAVYERSLGTRGRVIASLFDNQIEGLVTLSGDDRSFFFVNEGAIGSRGFEVTAEWQGAGAAGARGRLSYSLQKTTESPSGIELSNSPRHMLKARFEVPLAAGRLWTGVNAQYMGSRLTLAGARVEDFTVASVTVSAPDLVRRLGLTAGVYNLFDTRFSDPGSEEHRQDALLQDGRNFRVKLEWTF